MSDRIERAQEVRKRLRRLGLHAEAERLQGAIRHRELGTKMERIGDQTFDELVGELEQLLQTARGGA
ncbi:hypothetical protein [Sediminimonas qiaohouensis]|uniref:hypothetical protein n=1 Tax=Sediminimonas qiaohouensis TaxID=552061 RepID=UPI000405191C|nr:hypothetical protein [Sediminimonas qiaohouensis]